jgi:hypothetical protein
MKKSKYDVRRTLEIENWGKVTATASALNSISIMLMEAASLNRKQGCEVVANLRDRQSKQIYDALAETGFYKD